MICRISSGLNHLQGAQQLFLSKKQENKNFSSKKTGIVIEKQESETLKIHSFEVEYENREITLI